MTDLLLFGGSGVISAAVAAHAVDLGLTVTAVTRGRSERGVPDGVTTVHADVHDVEAVTAALAGRHFDHAVSFVAYSAADVDAELDALAGLADHVVLVSTCSVHARPPWLPIVEDHPRASPRFDYPAGKIAAEDRFWERVAAAPVGGTVVRAAHVIDHRTLPLLAGWTEVDRARRGLPLLVHGDGGSLWNLIDARDFATAFVPLLLHPDAVGRTVQLTHPEVLSWDQITAAVARAAGVAEPVLVHRSADEIGAEIDWMGLVCREDFGHSMVYDSGLLGELVPGWTPEVGLEEGLRRAIDWLDRHPGQRVVDAELAAALDRLTGVDPAGSDSGAVIGRSAGPGR